MKRLFIALVLVVLALPVKAGTQAPRKLVAEGGGGGATITRLGYQEMELSDSATTFNWGVTIPASTTAIVITANCYNFTATPLASATLGAQNFVIDTDANIDPASDAGVGIGHLFSPALTGSQTVSITVAAHGYAGRLYIIYYEGTAVDGIRDSDSIGGSSLTLTTQSGDRVVSASTNPENADIVWTNATEITEYTLPASYRSAIADTVVDGTTETISVSEATSGLASIVLKPGS